MKLDIVKYQREQDLYLNSIKCVPFQVCIKSLKTLTCIHGYVV